MSDTPQTVSADDLAADLAGKMPSVNVPASSAPEAPAPAPAPAAAPVQKDSIGRLFDPAKFRPEKDILGRWKNLFAGRGGKAAAVARTTPPAKVATAAQSFIPGIEDVKPGEDAPPPPPAPDSPAPGPVSSGPDKYALLADVYTRAAIAAAMGVFSDEWAPDDAAEYAGLRDSVAAYLRATQREDLSPGWALALAGLTYGARRLPRPKTQGRLAYYKSMFAAWWQGRKVARAVAAMPPPEALS
jgi:hypothetical protein